MSGKLRFQIPSIEEMEDDMSSGADKVKMQPLFKTHRHVKIDDDSTNVNKSISSHQTVHPSVSAKPSNSCSSNSSIQNRQGWQNRVNISSTNQQSSSGNFGTSKAPVKESVTQNRSVEPAPNGCVPKPVTSHSVNSLKTATVTSENNSTATNTQGQDASLPLPSLKPGKTNSIIVSARQRGNPVLKHVRNVPWEFGDVVPDYVLGQTTCALFLSLRYHHLNPNYIHERLKQLGHSFDGRILLVQVDVQDPHHSLKELAKICILADCTLILAWSPEEAGRYLETYKAFESKPPDLIMERTENEYLGRLTDCLTTVKKVNKPDAVTLMSTFGSLEKIIQADRDDLSLCPGFGPQKAQRLYDVFHEPFLKSKKKKLEDSPVKDAAKEQIPVKR